VFDKAIADYNEAVRLDPNHDYAYRSRASLRTTCPDAKYRDGKKAVQSATTACELSEWKGPDALDILAAAHAEAGAFEPAVKWESRAIELVSDDEARENYRNRLELYRQKKPYRATNH
jgi:tetratricopeptide (TPR) repeat protein